METIINLIEILLKIFSLPFIFIFLVVVIWLVGGYVIAIGILIYEGIAYLIKCIWNRARNKEVPISYWGAVIKDIKNIPIIFNLIAVEIEKRMWARILFFVAILLLLLAIWLGFYCQ